MAARLRAPGRGPSRSWSLWGVLALGLSFAGCGELGAVGAIRASVNAYITGLVHRDPAEVCRAITPAFWSGTEQEINTRLVSLGGQAIPKLDCEQGLRRYFQNVGGAVPRIPPYSVTDIRVSGNRAVTTVTGVPNEHVHLLNVGGVWRIDCCAGQQIDEQPTATYRVPSGAMEPTLKIGQTITSNNAAIRAHPPALGDIIVFHPPAGADPANAQCGDRDQGTGHPQACAQPTTAESSQTFIKRVVAGPGDTISIVNGHVIRNGVREQDPYIYQCGGGPDCNFPKPIVIPAGQYFVLGDNRGLSDDSRFWGPVKRAWIIGVVKP
jgi:signal peptidase I